MAQVEEITATASMPVIPKSFDTIKTDQNKNDEDFRVYSEETTNPRVVEHYRDMRKFHTVNFYRKMEEKFSFESGHYRKLMTIDEAFAELENYVDSSDPDLELPNKFHLLQTAEGIRRAGHPDWMQLVGLLHDMGKIMFLWGSDEDGQEGYTPTGKQWALGGDTFVLGCAIPSSEDQIVFPQFNKLNPDMSNPKYNTKYGMYQPNCGLDSLLFAWGHDEYMYRMLKANDEDGLIPREGYDMIRYHSAYPMHDKNAYHHLLNLEEDEERMEWIRLFNRFDLYTKDGENKTSEDLQKDLDDVWPYYTSLLEKYGLSGKLKW